MMQKFYSPKSGINFFNIMCIIYTKNVYIFTKICKNWVKFRSHFQFNYCENVAKVTKYVCKFYTFKSFLTFGDFGRQLPFFKSLNYLILRSWV